jgi:glycine hydroxymethyltransferase
MPALRSLYNPLRTSLLSSTSTTSALRPFVRMSSSIPIPNDFNKMLYEDISVYDPEVNDIIEKETWRQFSGLELIASENLTSLAVMQANGSILTNKYSEGLPGARYYGGNEYIDVLENLTRERALKAFNLDPKVWGVNVQPYSGSTANFAAFTALINPQDRIMGLGLPDGGHLTHGYYTAKKKITASSIYFQSFPYRVEPKTGLIDYEQLETNANLFKPRLVVCGGSAYPRDWEYERLRKIADSQGAYLMSDMAHISGLVAAAEQNSPFEYCDVVTTTTHKTLRGPRAGLIFFRKDKDDLENRVNAAVFPACQGGPHNNTIAGICVALKQAAEPAFKDYAKQVRANAAAMANVLFKHGYRLQTDGTANHLILWDLRPIGLTGSKIEKICDAVHITLNKNAVAGDTSALVPGGVRIGSSALTSRSMVEKDVEQVAEFLHRVVQISLQAQKEAGSKKLKDFVDAFEGNGESAKLVKELKEDVKNFCLAFPLPGVKDTTTIKQFD